jgi:two-component system, LuxR family, response regulator FixJ
VTGQLDQTVFVVDDDVNHGASIRQLMDTVSYDVELFTTGDEFLNRITTDDAGCVLIDVRLPGMSGIELQERLVKAEIVLPVIIMTAFGEIPIVVSAFQQGAIAFLEKPYSPSLLIDRVNAALRKDREDRANRTARTEVEKKLAPLTNRERQVLCQLIDGHTTKEIARNLDIGLTTVDFHRGNILQKMDVDGVTELVRVVVGALGTSFRAVIETR